MTNIVCEECGAVTAGYDTVNYGSTEVGHRVLSSWRLPTAAMKFEVGAQPPTWK